MTRIRTAMVLAAGLGTRLRPITDHTPKPLVAIAGRTLLDRGLDALARAGVTRVVVNVHHLGDQIIAHLSQRHDLDILVSDERGQLLDSGGGVVKALPLLGADPFFLVNADTFWIDGSVPDLDRLALAWRRGSMDILLMLVDPEQAHGHMGGGDFSMEADGTLRRARGADGALIYAGAAIIDPRVLAGAPATPHSLNVHFDRAIAARRLFGLRMDGTWITVGTPDAIAAAEAVVAARG